MIFPNEWWLLLESVAIIVPGRRPRRFGCGEIPPAPGDANFYGIFLVSSSAMGGADVYC